MVTARCAFDGQIVAAAVADVALAFDDARLQAGVAGQARPVDGFVGAVVDDVERRGLDVVRDAPVIHRCIERMKRAFEKLTVWPIDDDRYADESS